MEWCVPFCNYGIDSSVSLPLALFSSLLPQNVSGLQSAGVSAGILGKQGSLLVEVEGWPLISLPT